MINRRRFRCPSSRENRASRPRLADLPETHDRGRRITPIIRTCDHSHLVQKPILLQSKGAHHQSLGNIAYLMTDPKYSGTGADWTQLLTDPALVSHLGELLQVYRDTPPERRDQALLEAMRNIKSGTGKSVPLAKAAAAAQAQPAATTQPAP